MTQANSRQRRAAGRNANKDRVTSRGMGKSSLLKKDKNLQSAIGELTNASFRERHGQTFILLFLAENDAIMSMMRHKSQHAQHGRGAHLYFSWSRVEYSRA